MPPPDGAPFLGDACLLRGADAVARPPLQPAPSVTHLPSAQHHVDPDDPLASPPVDHSDLAAGIGNAIPPPCSNILNPISETPTPLDEHLPDLAVAGVLGNVLPTPTPPTPPIAKAARNLRLPSFDMLGIANPHPDRISSSAPQSTLWIGAGPLSQPNDPLHLETRLTRFPIVTARADSSASLSPSHVLPGHKSVQRYILTQTPPDDGGRLDWEASDARATTTGPTQSSTPSTQPNSITSRLQSTATTTPAMEGNTPLHRPQRQDAPWLRDALPLILDNVAAPTRRGGQVTVLSQALPVPSSPGHAFALLIKSINNRIQPQSMVWINVFHAVPGTLNLADLPTSPPTTPAPPHEGEDYFTTKVFDSAVAVPDYQANEPVSVVSPRPAVAPCSVDFIFVERYIPPTSAKEFSELFFEAGRSILSDRLVELSANNGTLLFVYPTRRGGRTFVNEYLSPILEPILRSAMVTEKLSYNLVDALGSMPAVDEMMTFEDLDARMGAFCEQLSSTGRTPLSKFHSSSTTYSLIHSSRQTVTLDKAMWAGDWWIKQEKPRIREAVKMFYAKRREQNDSDSPLFAGIELVEKILTGVRDRRYPLEAGEGAQRREKVPTAGIEIGVFLVQKSSGRPASSGGIAGAHVELHLPSVDEVQQSDE